jgi:membrane peptidoglycan carboxypeptidase
MSKPASERLSPARVLSHLGVMAAVATVMGVVAAGLAIPFAGALGLGAESVAKNMEDLPTELETEDLAQRTTILDQAGKPIATLYDENRVNVPLSQMSRKMVKAIVAIEDYRFYQHGALDLKGTVRALVTNQASGSQVQGGSSITQQLVKLTLINQAKTKEERIAATDNTYARKIRELRYAIAMEKEHSKDWILERYLNTAYFGDGAYGVQAASRHFFSKNAKRLNLRQAAVLAGLVKNPVGYDPTSYPDKAIERRNVVLDRMAELNVVSQHRVTKLKKKDLGLKIQRQGNGCVNATGSFFCDYVVSYLLQDKSLGDNVKQRRELLYSGGLTIHTTLDQRYQTAAQNSVARHVYATDAAVGGLAMVEPGTGQVRALAQSRPMGNTEKGQTYLNYTVPKELGGAQGFQPGSTFKAFVLATAIGQGIPLDYSIYAPQQITIQESEYEDCGDKPYGYGEWDPANSTSSGQMTLYTGTRLSVNTFFAQLEAATGLCEPFRLAKKMGVKLTQPKADSQGYGAERTPTFTLGIPSVSPLEMAEAYATFAAHGLHCDSTPVTSIEDSHGELVKEYKPKCQQVMETGVADAVSAILRGVQEPGGFGYGADLDLIVPSAAKTGTTQSQQAVWFVGYTPAVATASMIAGANSQGEPISLRGQTVGGAYVASASGSGFAGPMWRDAMRPIQNLLPDTNFPPPNLGGIPKRGFTSVPSVSGMSIEAATTTLHQAGFKVATGPSVSSGSPLGTVGTTYPSGGAQSITGGVVLLAPSNGVSRSPGRDKGRNNGGNHGGNHGGGRGR